MKEDIFNTFSTALLLALKAFDFFLLASIREVRKQTTQLLVAGIWFVGLPTLPSNVQEISMFLKRLLLLLLVSLLCADVLPQYVPI